MARSSKSVKASQPIVVVTPTDFFPHSNLGNAERFIAKYNNTYRYDHKRKTWLRWMGNWWEVCTESRVYRSAVQVIRDTKEKARLLNDTAMVSWMNASESGNHISDILNRSRNLTPISVEQETWDKDPYLFGVANGIIDLRTGTFRQGKRSDHITLHSPVVYDANCQSSSFDKFFDEIFLSRADLATYVLKALGYSMTGDTRERCLFIMHGSGNNGKSILSSLIGYIMGDYGKSTPSETLSAAREEGPRNDIARLAGSRYVTASETELRKGVAEGMLKRITGKDVIVARYLHQEFFEFVPKFKFWLSCNHKPPIQGTDSAIWCRIPLIPFDGEFRDDKDDKNLDVKLRAEASGILNRLIEGCLLWQKEGLQLPECIKIASADYRSESNPIAPFLDTCCECDQSQSAEEWPSEWAISKSDLYDSYVSYCHKMRIKPDFKNTFGANMKAAGFIEGRNKVGRWWKGIKML